MRLSQRSFSVALLFCLPLWATGCKSPSGDGGPEPSAENRWCTPEDLAVLDRDAALAVMVGCTADCTGESNVDTCARACFLEQVEIRPECSECFVSNAKCLDESCRDACESGLDSSECAACGAENCDSSMETCVAGPTVEAEEEEGSGASDESDPEGSAAVEPFIPDGSGEDLTTIPEGSGSDEPFIPDGSAVGPDIP
jgi:hypothetical protein